MTLVLSPVKSLGALSLTFERAPLVVADRVVAAAAMRNLGSSEASSNGSSSDKESSGSSSCSVGWGGDGVSSREGPSNKNKKDVSSRMREVDATTSSVVSEGCPGSEGDAK